MYVEFDTYTFIFLKESGVFSIVGHNVGQIISYYLIWIYWIVKVETTKSQKG